MMAGMAGHGKDFPDLASIVMLQLGVIGTVSVALAGLTRAGIGLWLWGITVMTLSGERASRARALRRSLIAWSPILLAAVVVLGTELGPSTDLAISIAASATWIAGTLYAIARPERGVQDQIAATWLVPR